MKRIHLDNFIKSIDRITKELYLNLINGDSNEELLKLDCKQLIDNLQSEIWDNVYSLDGLELQYSCIQAYYIFHFKKEHNRIKKLIREIRYSQNERKFDLNNRMLHFEEVHFLMTLDEDIKYLIDELRNVLIISPKHRQEIEHNKMLSTLETLFKYEEDYIFIMDYLIKKEKVDSNYNWIDKNSGYLGDIADLISTLSDKKYLKINNKSYNSEFIQTVIKNTFNIEISTSMIERMKSTTNSEYHSDIPNWENYRKNILQISQKKN